MSGNRVRIYSKIPECDVSLVARVSLRSLIFSHGGEKALVKWSIISLNSQTLKSVIQVVFLNYAETNSLHMHFKKSKGFNFN